MLRIDSYRPAWRGEFAALGAGLRATLDDLALRIDHIGSTAVPGLPAKDIIDIQVTVADLSPTVDAALTKAGWRRAAHISADHVPPGAPTDATEWAKWLFNEPAGARRVNLHVRVAGRANQRYALLFRDYLRAHPAAAEAYAQVKTALAHYHADDSDAYYAVKDPVCDIIMAGAQAWAAATDWQPPTSDA